MSGPGLFPPAAEPSDEGRRFDFARVAEDQIAAPGDLAKICLALVALEMAIEQLEGYALATDMPLLGVVEAADRLDAARAGLASALAGGQLNVPF